MDTYVEQRSGLLVFIVSINLHIVILILLFMIQPLEDTMIFDPATKPEDLSAAQFDISKILSQSPAQGPMVIFQDDPEPTEKEDAKMQPPTSIARATMPTAEPIDESNDTETEEPFQEETSIEIPTDTAREHAVPLPLTQADRSNAESEQKPTTKKKKKKKSYSGKPSQQAAAALGKITQGFIRSFELEQGTVPKAQTDLDALARQIYGSKVWGMLRQSVNSDKKLIHLNHDLNAEVMILLTIDRKGTLLNFSVEHPNKNAELKEIEELLNKAAHRAGLYPIIPAVFKKDILTLRFPLRINGENGFHTYEMSYN